MGSVWVGLSWCGGWGNGMCVDRIGPDAVYVASEILKVEKLRCAV